MLATGIGDGTNVAFIIVGLFGMLGTLGAALLTLRAAAATHKEVRSPNGTTTAEAIQDIKKAVNGLHQDQVRTNLRAVKVEKELVAYRKTDKEEKAELQAAIAAIQGRMT